MPNDLSPDSDTKNLFFHHPKRPVISPAKELLRRSPIKDDFRSTSSSEENSLEPIPSRKLTTPIDIVNKSPSQIIIDDKPPSVSPPGFSFSSNVSS